MILVVIWTILKQKREKDQDFFQSFLSPSSAEEVLIPARINIGLKLFQSAVQYIIQNNVKSGI